MSQNEKIKKLIKYLIEAEEFEQAIQTAKKHPLKTMLATTHLEIAKKLHRKRKYSEAEKHYQEAIKTYRQITKNQPKYLPDLAQAYNNIAILYRVWGRYEEAEKHYKEAIRIYEELAERNPEAYRPDLAMTYNNIANLYGDWGRYEEAEKHYKEAIKIRRELAERNSEAYLPDLAATYNNIGALYWKWGRYEEAEKHYKEAIKIRRELAERNPEAYRPDLAMTYNNIANLYGDWGRYEEAEKHYKEAIKIRRELAERNSEAYLPDLAATYNNIGALYWKWGRYEEAEKHYKEAIKIRRELAERNPEAYRPDLAMTYNNIANLYGDWGRYEEAEKHYKEAIKIRRELAERNPEAYRPDLAGTYNNIAILYGDWGRYEEAEKHYKEAIKIYGELAERNPEAYRPDLAMTYNNIANLYGDWGRYEEAEKHYKEAIKIYGELAEKKPEAYSPDLAGTYNNMGLLYYRWGRYEEAEKHYKEAIKIYGELAEKKPEAYRPDLAGTYNNMGLLYYRWGRYEEAEKHYKEAIKIYGELAERNPEAYRPDLAGTYNNIGLLYGGWGRYEEAEKHIKEAIRIRRELAERNPETYQPDLAMTYNDIATLYWDWGRLGDAEEFFSLCGDIVLGEPYVRFVDGRIRVLRPGIFDVLIRYLYNYGRFVARKSPLDAIKYFEYGLVVLRDYSFGIRSPQDLAGFFVRFDKIARGFVDVVSRAYEESGDLGFLRRGARLIEELKFVPLLRDLASEASPEYISRLRSLEAELSSLISRLRELEKSKGGGISVPSEIEYVRGRIEGVLDEIDRVRMLLYEGLSPPEFGFSLDALPKNSLFISIILISEKKDGSEVRRPFFIWIYGTHGGCGYSDFDVYDLREKLFDAQETLWNFDMLKPVMDSIAKNLPKGLIETLDQAIKNKHTIIISPHGPAHDIPWEAIDPSIVLGGQSRPIGLHVPVFRLYGPILPTRGEVGEARKIGLVVGVERPCPKDAECEILILRGISDEVKHIGNLINASPIIIDGQDPDSARRLHGDVCDMLRDASLFYFSGHGFSASLSPLHTINYLLFYRYGEELRILPSDVLAERRGRFVAFLNACRTGRGAEGRGLLDFRGGFIHSLVLSGFGSVVVSLWSVRNRSAKVFAESLFDGLRRMDVGGALVGARRKVFGLGSLFGVDAFAFVVYGSLDGFEGLREFLS